MNSLQNVEMTNPQIAAEEKDGHQRSQKSSEVILVADDPDARVTVQQRQRHHSV